MRLHIDPKALAHIKFFVNTAKGEVSGLGCVELQEGIPVVTDIFLLKQKCTGTSTDLDEGAVMDCILQAHAHGKVINYWWHSHADMKVFWSGTDLKTIEKFGKNGQLYFSVFNKKGDVLSGYYQASSGSFPKIYIPEIETRTDVLLSAKEIDTLENIFVDNVSENVFELPDTVSREGNKFDNLLCDGYVANEVTLNETFDDECKRELTEMMSDEQIRMKIEEYYKEHQYHPTWEELYWYVFEEQLVAEEPPKKKRVRKKGSKNKAKKGKKEE